MVLISPFLGLNGFVPFQDLGVFIPPMSQGMRTDFFLDGSFMPTRMKLDRETVGSQTGGLADMFGQMPGEAT